jgi:hypothetical protein
MTTLPTRQQVDRAEPLDFPSQRPVKNDLTITVKATIDGFPTEVCFTGSMDQLLSVTKRLRELGAAPTIAPATHTAPLGGARKPAERTTPQYLDSDAAVCPVHGKELQPGRYGLYCPSRASGDQAANDKGYCNLKFAE